MACAHLQARLSSGLQCKIPSPFSIVDLLITEKSAFHREKIFPNATRNSSCQCSNSASCLPSGFRNQDSLNFARAVVILVTNLTITYPRFVDNLGCLLLFSFFSQCSSKRTSLNEMPLVPFVCSYLVSYLSCARLERIGSLSWGTVSIELEVMQKI